MAKLARKRIAASGRKAERFGRYGRQFEEEMERLLQAMRDEGLLHEVVRHLPNSPEDHDGRDFTVAVVREGERCERSFGVTISYKRSGTSRSLHPDVPQFCFPFGTKPETIRRRILELLARTTT